MWPVDVAMVNIIHIVVMIFIIKAEYGMLKYCALLLYPYRLVLSHVEGDRVLAMMSSLINNSSQLCC